MKCQGTTPSETNEGPTGPVARPTPSTMKDHLDQLDSRIADRVRKQCCKLRLERSLSNIVS